MLTGGNAESQGDVVRLVSGMLHATAYHRAAACCRPSWSYSPDLWYCPLWFASAGKMLLPLAFGVGWLLISLSLFSLISVAPFSPSCALSLPRRPPFARPLSPLPLFGPLLTLGEAHAHSARCLAVCLFSLVGRLCARSLSSHPYHPHPSPSVTIIPSSPSLSDNDNRHTYSTHIHTHTYTTHRHCTAHHHTHHGSRYIARRAPPPPISPHLAL